MEWIVENWVFVLLLIGFIAMHVFGHGHHGNQGGRRDGNADNPHHQH